jgi:hypothetical protein
MKKLTLIWLSLFLLSCVTPQSEKQKLFTVPVIVQDSSKKTIETFNTNSINQSMAIFIGKSAFCDSYSFLSRCWCYHQQLIFRLLVVGDNTNNGTKSLKQKLDLDLKLGT